MSEGADDSKTNSLNECVIYLSCYFLNINFRFPQVCNVYHTSILKDINFNDAAVVTVKENDYTIHFLCMGKDKAINVLRKADFTEKVGTL